MRIAIVVSRYNQNVTQGLLDGALSTLRKLKVSVNEKDIVWVPGAFEIPFAVKALLKKRKYDAAIALGCVIKGQTQHNHYISLSVSHGLMLISLESGVPVAFGVLTPNNMKQAQDRSGKGSSNKGSECAHAAVEMIEISRRMRT